MTTSFQTDAINFINDFKNKRKSLRHDSKLISSNIYVMNRVRMTYSHLFDAVKLNSMNELFFTHNDLFLTLDGLEDLMCSEQAISFLNEIENDYCTKLYKFFRYLDVPVLPGMQLQEEHTVFGEVMAAPIEEVLYGILGDFSHDEILKTSLLWKVQALVSYSCACYGKTDILVTERFLWYLMNHVGFKASMDAYFDDPYEYDQPFDDWCAKRMENIAQADDVADFGFVARSLFPNSTLNKVKETVDRVHNMATRLDDSLNAQYSTVQGFSTMISDSITKLFTKEILCSDASAMIFELAMDMISDYRSKVHVPLPRWISYVSRILRLFGVNSLELAYNFVTHFKEHFDMAANRAQGAKCTLEIIVTLVGLIVTGYMPGKDNIKKVTDLARFYNAVVPPVGDFMTIIRGWIDCLPVCAQAWLNVLVPDTFWREAMAPDAPAAVWLEKATHFVEHENMMTIQYDNVKVKDMNDLHEAGHFLQRQFALCKDIPSSIQILITQTLNKLDAIYLAFEAHNKNSSIRATPFCVCFYGASQAGKSTLGNVLSRYMFPDVPKGKLRYVRKVAEDFWSGYVGQPVVCYDDAFQNAEMLDALELFDQISNAPCPLNMPSLNDPSIGIKGTYQRAKLFVLCTNSPFPDVRKVVTNEEAFLKRRHLLIDVEVVKNKVKPMPTILEEDNGRRGMYEDRGFYPVGRTEIVPDYQSDYSHLKFTLMDSVRPHVKKAEFADVKSLFKYVKSCYDEHMEQQEKMMAAEDTFIATYLNEALEDENQSQGVVGVLGKLGAAAVVGLNAADLVLQVAKLKELYAAENCTHNRTIALLTGLRALANVFLVYKGLTSLLLSDESQNEMEGKYSRKDPKIRKPKIYAQSTTDPNAFQIAKDSIGGRMGYMSARWSESVERSMCVLPLGGTVLLTPYHLFLDGDGQMIQRDSKLTLVIEGATRIARFDPRNLLRLKNNDGSDKDVCMYKFGIALRPFRRIDGLFVTEQDLSSIVNVDAWLMKYNKGISERQLVKVNPLLKKEYYSLKDLTFTLNRGWIYEAVTEGGDCGSPLVMFNTKLPRKLLGIHVSARSASHRAYAETVTYECLMQGQHLFKDEVVSFQEEYEYCEDEQKIELQGNLSFLGVVPKNRSVYGHVKTDIEPSLIYEKVTPHITEPSVLSMFDERLDETEDPLVKGVNKYSVSALPFETEVVEEIREHLFDIVDAFKADPVGDVGEYKAINGDNTIKFCEPLNMHTSTGYPYNFEKGDKSAGGKRWLFDGEPGDYVVSNTLLRKRLDERLKLAKNGFRYDSMSIANLKDERREISKIKAGKTRHFSLFPTDYVILCKRFMQEFIVAWYGSYLKTFVAVGMDPYSVDSNILMEELEKVSDVGFDGDFKTFDGKIAPEFFEELNLLMERFYKNEPNHEENMRIRRVLVNEAVHTIELARNTLYAKHNGDPSGFPLTTLFNCIVNYYYMSYCYLKTVPSKYRSMKHFHELVKLFVFGDDNIAAVSREIIPYFNLVSVSETLAQYDIEYVPNAGGFTAVRPVMDLTFLKNSFRREGKHVFAMLDMDVIMEMCNWVRGSNDKLVATVDNCNTALRYAYFYGYSVFNKIRAKLNNALLSVTDKSYNLYTYPYLDRIYKEEGSFRVVEELEADLNVAQSAERPTEGIENKSTVTTDHADNLDKKVGVVDEQNSINFVEQSGVTFGSLPLSVAPDMALSAMEQPWTAARVLGKPQRFGTYAWNTTMTPTTAIAQFYPFNSAYNSGLFGNILYDFMYFRATCVIRIEVNGIRFNSGRLIAFAVPMTLQDTVAKWQLSNQSATTSLPNHVFIDACDNTVAELELPFFYYENYYKSIQGATNASGAACIEPWNVNIAVFNLLRAATGSSTSINFTIWYYFKDVELRVPLPLAQSDELGITINLKGWDRIIQSFLPKNIIKDVYDLVRGRDKPNDTIQPVVMVRKPIGYMSNSHNLDRIQRFAFDPSKQEEIPRGLFGTSVDEMDFNHLKRITSFVSTYNITTSMVANTYLWQSVISPIMSNPKAYNTTSWSSLAASTPAEIPWISYLAAPFSYWRGSMRVKVDAVTTSFHTCKLGFYIAYGFTQPLGNGSGYDPATAYTTFFEINGEKKCYEFDVPYIAASPWKRVANTTFTEPGSVTTQPGSAYLEFVDNHITGYMGIFVVHPLVAPVNVANNIDINIFVGGGDDFELAYIGTNNAGLVPSRNQGNADGNEDEVLFNALGWDRNKAQGECTPVGPVRTSKLYPSGLDKVDHLKDIMKRYVPIAKDYQTMDTRRIVPASISNYMSGYSYHTGNARPYYCPNGFSHWTACYRAHIGGVRFKIVRREFQQTPSLEYYPTPRVGLSFSPEQMPQYQWVAQDYQSPYNLSSDLPVETWQMASANQFDAIPSASTTIVMTRGPVDIITSAVDMHEIEIPWERPFTMTLNSVDNYLELTDFGSVTSINGPFYVSFAAASYRGTLWTYTDQVSWTVPGTPPTIAYASEYYQMFMSAADDFRLGGFLGVPNVRYFGIPGLTFANPVMYDGWFPTGL
jgi:hypothetical protein